MTLFVWWEIAAITSVFLVWAPGTRMTYLAGMRYLTIQVLSGVLLLAGVVLVFREISLRLQAEQEKFFLQNSQYTDLVTASPAASPAPPSTNPSASCSSQTPRS